MELEKVKKISFVANAVILTIVFGLMAFFYISDVMFLTYFSIPTIFVYLIGFVLISKEKLLWYVRMVFIWLTLYMCVTTVCLGYDYGFHMYCFSVIPISFISEYIGYKINSRKLKAFKFSICMALLSLISTGYVAYFGPVYEREHKYAAIFWLINSSSVMGFLIFYANFLIKTIISSEEKLNEIALVDRLTGLYNRHYMINCLDKMDDNYRSAYLAMADIDDFKKINDTYGHNAGDLVLEKVSQKMKAECKGCTVSRWGGEEFLILIPPAVDKPVELIEKLRQSIASENVRYEDKEISVTITAGISPRTNEPSIDRWIQTVDSKLYDGKHSGKNKVVS
ncbi:GGDEF domain-containing protein [uncultured Ruminococcus sp.]|uniref:GGDEF domain-containing protein n=1 Tax=uncultured Ruminococcus sp. TaxID=165186 RepID=UPI000EC7BF2A|nr:GGDEF domain-containing protein [uncultured Ruminococcus sp.]HCJ40797.1 GGDEF domain-containing protein [Ruminococcus sp.]